MLFQLSNLNSNLTLTLGYLNPALDNSAQAIRAFTLGCTLEVGVGTPITMDYRFTMPVFPGQETINIRRAC